MSWHRTAHRLDAINTFRFPALVRQRFASEHDTLSQAGLDQIESATRQWFRLTARHPRARPAMPSSAAHALWRELSRQSTDYAAFTTRAFGRPFPPADDRPPAGLAETLKLAREDEGGGPATLPLLFRVDQQVAFPGGHRYLADCGGRGTCHDLPGALCLQHAGGTGRLIRGRNTYGPLPPGSSSPGGGCGGGCGGGGM
ncbi:hypothetical protein [Paractinoplanes maris]|uniref:hypothetical protein n=1 Tax=Paractinoplanes maris TaxID=1734446 RepID=UPI002020EC49|nr:hypothetical protein [Actinoplanes maris]